MGGHSDQQEVVVAKNKYRPASKPQMQALIETCVRAGIDSDEEIPISDDTFVRVIRSGKLVVRFVRTRRPQQPERFYYDIASVDESARPHTL